MAACVWCEWFGLSKSERKWRVLIAAHGFPPEQTAGAEWRAHRTAIAAQRAGHNVTVLAADPVAALRVGDDVMVRAADSQSGRDAEGVSVRVEEVDGILVHRLSFDVNPGWGRREEYDNRVVYKHVRDLIAGEHFDVVHLISGYLLGGSVIEAASTVGVPVVVTLTDFWFLCPRLNLRKRTGELCTVPEDPMGCVLCLANDQRRYRIPHELTRGVSGRALIRLWRNPQLRTRPIDALSRGIVARREYLGAMLRCADRLIAPSKFLHDLFVKQGISKTSLLYMRQGLDVDGWEPIGVPSRRVDEQAPLRIGYIGQLTESKGVADLVEAIRKLPAQRSLTARPPQVRLFGEFSSAFPDFRRRLEADIESDPRIVLAGKFDNRLIRQVHSDLDVLVVPSRWYENSPNVILEAFACGTPVIAADLGGMAELVVHDVNGLLFPAGDIEALGACLERVLNEPDLLPRLASRIPPVKTIAEEMAELEQVYAQVIAERRRKAR